MSLQICSKKERSRGAGGIKFSLERCLILLIFFCLLYLPSKVYAQTSQNTQRQLEAVERTFADLAQRNAYVESLDYNDLPMAHLPIGMKRTVSGMEVTIAVNRFALGPAHSELAIYAKAIIPQGSDGRRLVLFFGAEGVKGTHSGGLADEVKLSLLRDIEIPFNGGNTSLVLKGGFNRTRGISESNTYMTINCDGFKNLALDAEVHFPTSLISSAINGEQVVGRFSTVIESWDDLLVSMSLPSFEIKGLRGYVFDANDVVFDFSSVRNSKDIDFPKEYEQGFLPDERTLWRGIYAKSVSVTLPKAFSNARFSAENLLIDDNGITGIFAADNVLQLDQGSASGWKFSVDRFAMHLVASELVSSELKGRLGLPFKGETTTLAYEGFMQMNDRYTLVVRPDSSLSFSIFNAEAQLDPSSYVKLDLIDDKFVPEAVLHGRMALGKTEGLDDLKGSESVKLASLKFRNLRLTTKAPYISVEALGYEGEAKLGDFPLSIHQLELGANERGAHLTLGAGLSLGKNLFSGKTTITLRAAYHDNVWYYEGMDVSEIALDAKIAGKIGLVGKLNWHRDDTIYGNGFTGDLLLSLGLGKTNHVSWKVRAGFGRKDSNSYWYADGLGTFPQGIPLVAPMTLNGIGGALTYGVRAEGQSAEGGKFRSAQYVPDESKGLGFKASTLFEISKTAQGEAALEIIFSRSGGLSMVGFYGYAQFPKDLRGEVSAEERIEQQHRFIPSNLGEQLKQGGDFENILGALSIKKLPEALKGANISGSIFMQLDLDNSSLHAVSQVYVSSPAGVIAGTGPDGLAGRGVLHIDPKEWYLHLGTPATPIGLKLNVGSILAVKSDAYLMAGSRIPGMPTPPQEVANLIGQDISRLSLGRNLDALSTGKGFAFGSKLGVRTGDLQFAIMYANFNAGLGFDVMLKDYGQAQCRGRSGTIGLNGWYAQGQAYAYLQGELGVKIKLWFVRVRVPVIRGGAAALLQAGLPDPTFFKGYLGVNLNVLGLVKGHARFKLSIGEECEVVNPGSSPVDEPMINDLSPVIGEREVSVFAVPQATFNVAMGKTFEASDERGVNKIYRISLKSFDLKDKDGKSITAQLVWGDDKTKLSLQAKEVLPPNTELTASVRVGFEEFINGSWHQVVTSGKPAIEEKTHTFTTGGAPSEIPLANVVYAYPVVGQSYFLPKESNKGYVQLKMGQKYLFEKGFDYKMSFLDEEGGRVSTDFNYNESENRLEFIIPSLRKKTPYTLSLAYTAQVQEGQESPKNNSTTHLDSEDLGVRIGGDRAERLVASNLEKAVLSYDFSTSQHSTFKEKMDALKIKDGFAVYDEASAYPLELDVRADEAFDEAEVLGVETTQGKALVQLKATLEEDYFAKTVYPLVYEGYPFAGLELTYRSEQPYGAPPYYAFAPSPYFLSKLSDGTLNKQAYRFPFTFLASHVVFADFSDLQGLVVNNRDLVGRSIYERFALGTLPVLRHGKYKALVSYVLPDGTVSSTMPILYNNNLKFNTER